jgi:hypothetical protein
VGKEGRGRPGNLCKPVEVWVYVCVEGCLCLCNVMDGRRAHHEGAQAKCDLKPKEMREFETRRVGVEEEAGRKQATRQDSLTKNMASSYASCVC